MKKRNARFALDVLAPCPEDWNRMPGSERVRFCERCGQNVYNLSAMSDAEARQVVSARQGPPCVRFFARGDGTVITRRCSPMLEAARRRGLALAAALAPVAAGFWGTVAWLRGLIHGPATMGAPPGPVMGAPRPPADQGRRAVMRPQRPSDEAPADDPAREMLGSLRIEPRKDRWR